MQTWCKCLHTITQCIVVLGLSPKDMHLYPNILPIRSLLEINFWVFHLRDLTLFLIRPLWGSSISHFFFHFIFAIFGAFSFSFPFHTTISLFFSFSLHNRDAYEVQLNHILTSTIFQDIILFTLIMFYNFQQSTQRFLLHFNHHKHQRKFIHNLYIIKTWFKP